MYPICALLSMIRVGKPEVMKLLLGSGGLSTPERIRAWKKGFQDFVPAAAKEVLFVPFALQDHAKYTQMIAERGFGGERKLVSLHTFEDKKAAIRDASVIYVGGGNTFRLLRDMIRYELLDLVRERVLGGLPYVGISAGSNLAGPTIKTTNDMPICEVPSFAALGLVPFQINPHYFSGAFFVKEGDATIPYGGETRDDRLREFHEENKTPILALYEGGILRVDGQRARIDGAAGARLFRSGRDPQELNIGTEMSFDEFK